MRRKCAALDHLLSSKKFSGRSRDVLAGALLYYLCRIDHERVSQREIAELFDVGEASVMAAFGDVAEFFDAH